MLPIVAREMPGLSLPAFAESLDPERVAEWTQSITAALGFNTAGFQLRGSKLYLEEWFARGLGRRVTRYAPDGAFVVWEGYVARMTLVEPGNRSTIALDGLANSVRATYAAVDASTNPPTVAAAASLTAAATDADSIARYGTHEEILAVGETTAALAAQKRDQHLDRVAWPAADDQFDTSQADDLRLEVECRGFGHTLAWRFYGQTANSGTDDADIVVGDVVTAAGEFIDRLVAEANTTPIPEYIDGYRYALDVLRGIASVGDAAGARWVMPVLEDRTMYYRPARTAVDYYRAVADPRQVVREKGGRALPPWEVRPDHWLRTMDVFPFGAGDPDTLGRDPQVRYLEEVVWSEPWGLSMFGSQKAGLPGLLTEATLPGLAVT